MECTTIPFWFLALAVWGAVSAASFVGFGILYWFAGVFADREEFVPQIDRKRKVFKSTWARGV